MDRRLSKVYLMPDLSEELTVILPTVWWFAEVREGLALSE
jgi:hypothetical protein